MSTTDIALEWERCAPLLEDHGYSCFLINVALRIFVLSHIWLKYWRVWRKATNKQTQTNICLKNAFSTHYQVQVRELILEWNVSKLNSNIKDILIRAKKGKNGYLNFRSFNFTFCFLLCRSSCLVLFTMFGQAFLLSKNKCHFRKS